MARVVALFDDLLLGSNVAGRLQAAGHEVSLAAAVPTPAAGPAPELLVTDLDATAFDPLAVAGTGPRTLGLYSHVEPETKRRAEAAGYDLVVPRSRFMREGPELVARLLA